MMGCPSALRVICLKRTAHRCIGIDTDTFIVIEIVIVICIGLDIVIGIVIVIITIIGFGKYRINTARCLIVYVFVLP